MATVNIQQYVDIDVDMDDMETDDLVEELVRRLKKNKSSVKGFDFDELASELARHLKVEGLGESTLFDKIVSEYISDLLKKYSFSEIQKALPL